MTRKIFTSIITVASVILLACFIIILGVLYENYDNVYTSQLKTQTALISHAVESEGLDYLDDISFASYRVTWIDPTGDVLYDSSMDAGTLENHADREEFIEAVESGFGKSSRYSSTLTEQTIYYAQRLNDGSVIRVSSAKSTVLTFLLGMMQPLSIVLILAIALSAFLASRLSKRIVKPLNELDLTNPLENESYPELSPLLSRIESLHRQVSAQMTELKRRQEEWATVTGNMKDGIILLSDKNIILSINKSALKLLNTDESCIGSDILSICRLLDIQKLLEKTSHGRSADIVLKLSGGEYQISASPILSDGTVKGSALLFFDVTDKMQAEQIRQEFTANVSHELKTPLHTISGSAEIIKNGLVEPKDIPRFIDRIYSESIRMITLVDDIIRLSRLDEGMEGIPRSEISLMEVIKEITATLTPAAEKMDVKITISGDSSPIHGIPPLIHELVYNLCDNAVKYNRQGGHVDISVKDLKNEIILTVSDTGIGIPIGHQSRIFERFYRVDKSHSKEIGGTGLGLSIVKHVAKLHNAKIDLTSNIGSGTTFTITFPRET